MKIYEFSTWFSGNNFYSVREIEVEEKPKVFVGKGIRVNKDKINVLDTGFGDKMYRLDNDPKPYIQAVYERKMRIVERKTKELNMAVVVMEKWFDFMQEMGCGE